MKVQCVPSSVGASNNHPILATYLINDVVAIDAGSLGLMSPLSAQRQVKHVFLSHSHLDHVATLPVFIDNVYVPGPDCPDVYAHPTTFDSLRRDFFNDRVWPDMIRLSGEESPFLRLLDLTEERPVEVAGLRVTPISLKHVVPTYGFLIEEIATKTAVLFVSDTSPCERIWEIANQCEGLKAVFLEASFPNSFRWLADKAAHLTPALFQEEVKKLKRDVPVYAIHIKIAFADQIVSELNAINLPNLRFSAPGETLTFE